MRSRLMGSSKLRRAGIATLLIGAAFALSGCWAVTSEDGRYTKVVLTKSTSDRVIYNCVARHQQYDQHYCGLDSVRYACHAQPLPRFPIWMCDGATQHALWNEMAGAFQGALFGNGGCLAVRIDRATWTYDWYSNPPSSCL